jgi:hypothetical protein
MVTGDLVRPAHTWRLVLAFALLLVLAAVALVATHAALGAPAHAPLLHHVRQIVCGGVSQLC